ncbi:MAG TPA: glutamate 5-kinase [Flavobacterium sp.]|nr:glutamate 5-kinase [Flavobacterium sp.]
MQDRLKLKQKQKIVIKIGTSSLTNQEGAIDRVKIGHIARVLSELSKQGRKVMLVTSGAIAVGASKLGYSRKPTELSEKQALAAIGQAELINIYAEAFQEYNCGVAQLLLTKDGITNPVRRENSRNTLNALLNMGIIPIINENDTIATDEIEIGDNDTLSAYVSVVADADLLIILSDIDGLYSGDPRIDPNAKIIHKVYDLTKEIEDSAKGAGSSFSTGGMVTKIAAARLCINNEIDMVIAKGDDPAIVFEVLEGKDMGTLFVAKEGAIVEGQKNYFFFG